MTKSVFVSSGDSCFDAVRELCANAGVRLTREPGDSGSTFTIEAFETTPAIVNGEMGTLYDVRNLLETSDAEITVRRPKRKSLTDQDFLGIAARVWTDHDFSDHAMDTSAAHRIAAILRDVHEAQR